MNITKYSGKRGTTWQVKVRRQGRYESATFKTKTEAENWGRHLEDTIVRARLYPDEPRRPTSHTVNELIDTYITRIVNHHSERTQQEYLHCLKYWRSSLGDTNVAHITPMLLADCQSYLRNVRGYDPQTVNKYCRAFSPALSLAAGPTL